MAAFNQIKVNLSKEMAVIAQKKLVPIAERYFKQQKFQLIKHVLDHPVSKEIAAGADASNSSGTLGGKGNLFSFIGFNAGDEPINRLKSVLEANTQFGKVTVSQVTLDKIYYSATATIPTFEDLENVSPMPWEGGRSWIRAVETGISNLSFYLFTKFSNASRSGAAIQTKSKVSNRNYRPTSYIRKILEEFKKNIQSESSKDNFLVR